MPSTSERHLRQPDRRLHRPQRHLLPTLFSESYTAAVSGTLATVLFAREETFRATQLGSGNINITGDTVSVAMSSLESETQVGLSWVPTCIRA